MWLFEGCVRCDLNTNASAKCDNNKYKREKIENSFEMNVRSKYINVYLYAFIRRKVIARIQSCLFGIQTVCMTEAFMNQPALPMWHWYWIWWIMFTKLQNSEHQKHTLGLSLLYCSLPLSKHPVWVGILISSGVRFDCLFHTST